MTMLDMTTREKRLAERIDMGVAHDLAISNSAGGLIFANATQVMEFAKMMALSQIGVRKHLRANPGACLAICVQAIEWEMSPFAVANKSYSVNDQIAFESQLIQAVILKRAPIKGRFKVEYSGEGDSRKCKISAELRDERGEIVEYESPELGKINPKNSPLWKTDPDQQLYYYSGRALCRRHFPDVLLGVYAVDEIPTGIGPDGAKDVSPVTAPKPSLQDRLDALATVSAEPVSQAKTIDLEAFEQAAAEATETTAGAPEAEVAEMPATSEALTQESSSDAEDDFPGDAPSLLDQARVASMLGRRNFDPWFNALTDEQKASLKDEMPKLMAAAKQADLAKGAKK